MSVHWSSCSAHPQWGGTESECTCYNRPLPPSQVRVQAAKDDSAGPSVALTEAARRLERIADLSSGDMTPQAVWGIRFAVRELRAMAAEQKEQARAAEAAIQRVRAIVAEFDAGDYIACNSGEIIGDIRAALDGP